jgi:iron complex transport system substrate-binding protein
MRRGAALLLAIVVAATARGQVEVRDDTGRTVRLAQPAQRIVTLAPHATELVFAVGAGDRLVGVAAYSDWPAAARDLPRVGGAGGLDRERLLLLQPDLVVAWASGSRPADLGWLERLGIAVYRSEPVRLADIAGNLRDLGRLVDRAAAAAQAAQAFEQALADRCPARDGPARALYLLWQRPLLTYGGRHWINDLLRVAGLHNLFGDVDRAVFTPDREAVLAGRPDYVLSRAAASPPLLDARPLVAPPQLDRPTPRILEGLADLCAQLTARSTGGAPVKDPLP